MTVTALWIEFERYLIGNLTSRVAIEPSPAPLGAQLSTHVNEQIEYSRFGELLDLFKGWIDSGTLGRVKQIKEYRDWISHRNPKRCRPATVDPIEARGILGAVMDQIA